MPIAKHTITGEIILTPPHRGDLFSQTGVANNGNFAICDRNDYIKQIKFDPSAQSTNTTIWITSGASSADTTLTLPANSGTFSTAAFKTVQTDLGTSPTATSPTDTLTLTSSDGSILITGNSSTDTVDLKAATTGSVVGPGSSTDNAVTRFDGTTGKLVQNSGVTLTDGNVFTMPDATGMSWSSVTGQGNYNGLFFNTSTPASPTWFIGAVHPSSSVHAYQFSLPTDGSSENDRYFAIKDSTGNSGGGNLFYVNQSGKVGIGTSTPGEKLEVSGNIKASGNLLLGSATLTPTVAGYLDPTSSVQTQLNTKLSTSLTSAHIHVGNGSNVAADVAMSGDATISNTGALTLAALLSSSRAAPVIMTGSGVGNTQTDSTGSLVDCTGFGFSIAASEVWAFIFFLQTGCNNTGGVDFAINGPSGATFRAQAEGSTSGTNTIQTSVTATLNTAFGVSFNTVSSQGGRLRIYGKIAASSTPGTVQLRFCAHTATQTATLYSESFGLAVRIA